MYVSKKKKVLYECFILLSTNYTSPLIFLNISKKNMKDKYSKTKIYPRCEMKQK